MSSPVLNNIILVGCVISYITVILQERNASTTYVFCKVGLAAIEGCWCITVNNNTFKTKVNWQGIIKQTDIIPSSHLWILHNPVTIIHMKSVIRSRLNTISHGDNLKMAMSFYHNALKKDAIVFHF